MFLISSLHQAWQGDMVNNLRDVFKKHLATSDPIIAKLITAMAPSKKKHSALPLGVKGLLLNPKPSLKFSMVVGNVDDFAYSDEEDEDDNDTQDYILQVLNQ